MADDEHGVLWHLEHAGRQRRADGRWTDADYQEQAARIRELFGGPEVPEISEVRCESSESMLEEVCKHAACAPDSIPVVIPLGQVRALKLAWQMRSDQLSYYAEELQRREGQLAEIRHRRIERMKRRWRWFCAALAVAIWAFIASAGWDLVKFLWR